jgi:hypothetical protein
MSDGKAEVEAVNAGDEEAADFPRNLSKSLKRTISESSEISIRSLEHRTTVHPSIVLPIHYRSVYAAFFLPPDLILAHFLLFLM